jgi:hypothetical protein
MGSVEKVKQGKNLQRTAILGGIVTLAGGVALIAALGLPHGASADKAFGKATAIELQVENHQAGCTTPAQQRQENALDTTGNDQKRVEDRYALGIGLGTLMLEVGWGTAFVSGSRMEDSNLPPAQQVPAGAGPNPAE